MNRNDVTSLSEFHRFVCAHEAYSVAILVVVRAIHTEFLSPFSCVFILGFFAYFCHIAFIGWIVMCTIRIVKAYCSSCVFWSRSHAYMVLSTGPVCLLTFTYSSISFIRSVRASHVQIEHVIDEKCTVGLAGSSPYVFAGFGPCEVLHSFC